MNGYNKVLYWVVTGILAVTLLSILLTSAVIYPPFAFLTQNKETLLRRLTVPSTIVMLCVLLSYMLDKKISVTALITITVTLGFNIFGGTIIHAMNTTIAAYMISGINFMLVPLCVMLLARDLIKLKLPRVLLWVTLIVIVLMYVVFVGMIMLGSYARTAGFMYLMLPVTLCTNAAVYINHGLRVFTSKVIVLMYAVSAVFMLYNIIWHIGVMTVSVLGIIGVILMITVVAGMGLELKKFIKR